MANLMGNREVLAPGFPNRISHDNRGERCSLRSHKGTVEAFYVQFIDIQLELFSNTAGIRRSGNFQLGKKRLRICRSWVNLRHLCV